MKALTILFAFVLLVFQAGAVELPIGAEDVETKRDRETRNVSTKSASQVSILCYHDFTARLGATEMRIKEESFTGQMRILKESGINVIKMSDFIAWKRGEKELPEKNVMITIDDGWRSVYQVAFPVLKKYNFPFTLGLYTEFIEKGELSLTKKMINEMLSNGMEISSHSVSHPFPSSVKKARLAGEQSYTQFLNKEFGESRVILEKLFRKKVETYIYPGGYYTQDMFPVMRSHGYEFSFTVKPGKITRNSVDLELPRYVVLGTTARLFEQALTFKAGALAIPTQKLPYPVKPEAGKASSDRLPWIGVDLSTVKNIDRDSVYMRVSGFGLVKAKFLKDTDRFEWQASRPLRSPTYSVLVNWRLKEKSSYEEPLKWTFLVDRQAGYLSTAEAK